MTLEEINKRMEEIQPTLAEYWQLMEAKYAIESEQRRKEKETLGPSIWDVLENRIIY
jgi:hypothetical protein